MLLLRFKKGRLKGVHIFGWFGDEAKIADLGNIVFAALEKDVLRLHVAMDQPMVMDMHKALDDLLEDATVLISIDADSTRATTYLDHLLHLELGDGSALGMRMKGIG